MAATEVDFSTDHRQGVELGHAIQQFLAQQIKNAAYASLQFAVGKPGRDRFRYINLRANNCKLTDEGLGLVLEGAMRCLNRSNRTTAVTFGTIELANNELTTASLSAIAQVLYRIRNDVVCLDLSSNAFTCKSAEEKEQWKKFWTALKSCHNLARVDLSFNRQMTEVVFRSFAKTFSTKSTRKLFSPATTGSSSPSTQAPSTPAHRLRPSSINFLLESPADPLYSPSRRLISKGNSSNLRSVVPRDSILLQLKDCNLNDAMALWLSYIVIEGWNRRGFRDMDRPEVLFEVDWSSNELTLGKAGTMLLDLHRPAGVIELIDSVVLLPAGRPHRRSSSESQIVLGRAERVIKKRRNSLRAAGDVMNGSGMVTWQDIDEIRRKIQGSD